MNPISKFGFSLLSLASVLIVILKIMTDYKLGLNTGFYAFLTSFAVVLPFILAIAMLLMIAVYIKSFLILMFFFGAFLVAGFIIIAPVYLGGL